MGHGLYLLAGGASWLLVAAFFAMALAGEYALARPTYSAASGLRCYPFRQ